MNIKGAHLLTLQWIALGTTLGITVTIRQTEAINRKIKRIFSSKLYKRREAED